MRGQWSFSFALIALAAAAFVFAVMVLAAPRFNSIDYSENLYLLKNKSMVINNIVSFYIWNSSLYLSGSVTQYFKPNVTIYYYLTVSSQKYLVAARLSRADKFINYTIYLCLLSCGKAVGPGGAPGYLFYISAYSTLDHLPTLEINGTFLEYAALNSVGGYYAPSAIRGYHLYFQRNDTWTLLGELRAGVYTCNFSPLQSMMGRMMKGMGFINMFRSMFNTTIINSMCSYTPANNGAVTIYMPASQAWDPATMLPIWPWDPAMVMPDVRYADTIHGSGDVVVPSISTALFFNYWYRP